MPKVNALHITTGRHPGAAAARPLRHALWLPVMLVFAALAAACAGSGSALGPTATLLPPASPIPTATAQPVANLPELTLQAYISPPLITEGQVFEVRTDSGGAGLAQYTLMVDNVEVCRVRHDGTLMHEVPYPDVEVISWQAGPSSAQWTLKALEPGKYSIGVFVTGEAARSAGGPFYWTQGSQDLQLTVKSAAAPAAQ